MNRVTLSKYWSLYILLYKPASMTEMTTEISPIEEIIAEARAGRMFILVDDEQRENEGDLVICGEFADKDAVNFMAKYGRGLICLTLESQQVQKLGLPPMARHNATRHHTNFTVSIEAREGVTTGISAADRAQTISVAINPQARAEEIVSPGHVFPLEAREGGVLVRAGHTEAAVDIARLAGCNPSGVICEIMNDDGSMARMEDLLPFAAEHGLKIGTIADLIAYRRRYDTLVARTHSVPFTSQHGGDFTLHIYTNTVEYAEHIVLVKGDLKASSAPLIRMHAADVLSDVLADASSSKSGELPRAMQAVSEAGCGAIVLIREPRRASVSDAVARLQGNESNKKPELRDYGIGAQILLDLGIRDMTLLTNSTRTIVALEGYELNIVGTQTF